MERNEIIAYAMDFASYLISKSGDVNKVILHGSVARGDFNDNSDIDLFIDVHDKKMEKKIHTIEDNYYKTESYHRWKLKGLKNDLSLIIGKLDSDEWKDLKRAILNTGLILYGKYTEGNKGGKHYVMFSFENIKPESKRVSLFRKLFGFKAGKKRYEGLSGKFGLKRLGKGTIIAPIEHVRELKQYFLQNKISVRLYDVWSDSI